jgi:hypothetical protein
MVLVDLPLLDSNNQVFRTPPVPTPLLGHSPVFPVPRGVFVRCFHRILKEGPGQVSSTLFQHDVAATREIRKDELVHRNRNDDETQHEQAWDLGDEFTWLSFKTSLPVFALRPSAQRRAPDLQIYTAYWGSGHVGNCDGQVGAALSRDRKLLEQLRNNSPHGYE